MTLFYKNCEWSAFSVARCEVLRQQAGIFRILNHLIGCPKLSVIAFEMSFVKLKCNHYSLLFTPDLSPPMEV